MNEALGGSGLFNIVIVIVSALVLLLVGFLAFSKAFKVKNHIVNFINEDKGYVDKVKIESDLTSVGYASVKEVGCKDKGSEDRRTTYGKLYDKAKIYDDRVSGCDPEHNRVGCESVEVEIGDPTNEEKATNYDYCVYKYTMANGSYYYTVLTYVHMNIPLIDDFIHIPITGETRIFERQYE